MAATRRTRSISAQSRGGKIFLWLFGGIFMLVGGGLVFGLTILPIAQWMGARQWEEVPCRIQSSEVGSHSSSDGTTYSVDITYAYEFNGQAYTSYRYNFVTGSSSGYEGKQRVVEQYPAGSEAVCFVNDAHPEEAVLSREFSYAYFIGLFGLLFFGAGLAVVVAGSLSSRRKSHGAATDNLTGPEGPLELKPAAGPLVTLIGVLFFTLIWNGVTFGILAAIFLSEGDGPDTFFKFFMIPFVLVGLLTIGLSIRQFLALFNPRPHLTLDPGVVRLGSTIALTWNVSGSTSSISTFKIWLVGTEEATYRRGTRTCTDHSEFEKIPIIEADNPSDMRMGEVRFSVPEFIMHSFEASNNKIKWSIKVHGDIKKWPDIDEEFPITVLPLQPASANTM